MACIQTCGSYPSVTTIFSVGIFVKDVQVIGFLSREWRSEKPIRRPPAWRQDCVWCSGGGTGPAAVWAVRTWNGRGPRSVPNVDRTAILFIAEANKRWIAWMVCLLQYCCTITLGEMSLEWTDGRRNYENDGWAVGKSAHYASTELEWLTQQK